MWGVCMCVQGVWVGVIESFVILISDPDSVSHPRYGSIKRGILTHIQTRALEGADSRQTPHSHAAAQHKVLGPGTLLFFTPLPFQKNI